jgi:hypothetical protein
MHSKLEASLAELLEGAANEMLGPSDSPDDDACARFQDSLLAGIAVSH